MSNILSSDFPLAKDSYVAFDGLSIKEKIRQRLNQTQTFTDQNFEGSNLAAWNDSFAMVMSLFLYNLNKSSNEGQFTPAQIYENVNRIVKDMDYSPIGHQTASLSFELSVSTLNAGIYTIPRYSTLSIGGIKYSFVDDFTFSKTQNTSTESVDHTSLLYQGTFSEFPTYTSSGLENEIFYLTTTDTELVDHFYIDVYVKDSSNKWQKFKKTQSLYLNDANQKVYECRYNENRRYEIKFGNGINGVKLNKNDQVAIFYLRSDGRKGEIGANVLSGAKLNLFNSRSYATIMQDQSIFSSILNVGQLFYLSFDNSCASSYHTDPETIDQIKKNAPGVYRSQYRVCSQNEYTTFVRSNFSHIVQDVKTMNNAEYLDSYIKYFFDLGVTKPQLESRALFSQMKFADSCNFNNVYLFVVPKNSATGLSYLHPVQKTLISETLKDEKVLTSDTIILDPVYLALDVAVGDSNKTVIADIPQTEIVIKKNNNARRTDVSIINDVALLIQSTFARKVMSLGAVLNVTQLTADMLAIDGVNAIYTRHKGTDVKVSGLQFILFNPIIGDASALITSSNKQIEDFQFVYLFTNDLTARIVVES